MHTLLASSWLTIICVARSRSAQHFKAAAGQQLLTPAQLVAKWLGSATCRTHCGAALQNGKTMVDGLDAANGTWLAADFATIVFRMKLLGFNAVRLPFRFTDLEAPTT
jgi:hypothetical protein